MKGRGNYLCRKKLYDLADQPVLNGLEEISHFKIISDWEKTTETGDRAELAELPENSQLWPKLDARTDRCIGSQCQQFDRCFITEMRRRAAESDIIIVNHHLFCADLAIKAGAEFAPDAGVLPEARHRHLRRSARTGRRGGAIISECRYRICGSRTCCATSIRRCAQVRYPCGECSLGSVQPGARALAALLCSLPPGEGRFAFENRAEFLEENGDEYLGLQNALLHLLYRAAGDSQDKPDEVHGVIAQGGRARAHTLGFCWKTRISATPCSGSSARRAARRRQGDKQNVFLQATPIDCFGHLLRTTLFDHLDSAVFTSATLAVGGGFEYIRDRVWASSMRASRSCLRTSITRARRCCTFRRDLPEPTEPQFPETCRRASCGSCCEITQRSRVLPVHQLSR